MTDSEEAIEMLLSMYDYDVPCIMELTSDECQLPASWLMWFMHVEDQDICAYSTSPLCTYHKRLYEKQTTGFWALFSPPEPAECQCGKMAFVSKFTEIRKPT